jgi:hypothetical protein
MSKSEGSKAGLVKGQRVKVLVGEWGKENMGTVYGPKRDMVLVAMDGVVNGEGKPQLRKFWPKDCQPA